MDDDSILGQILNFLLGAYIISTQIMSVYFWWKMMKVDSFWVGILIDPFIAEFKGILWPFFV